MKYGSNEILWCKLKIATTMKPSEINFSSLEDLKFSIKNSGIFLDTDFNLDRLSHHLSIQTYIASKLLRERYDITFSDFKNYLRIDYAMDKIKEGFLEKHTVDALAKECGYSGRSHFSKAFTTFTGMTVGEANNKLFKRKNKGFLIYELK